MDPRNGKQRTPSEKLAPSKKKRTGKKIGSKKGPEKNWHLEKMTRNQKTESKELQLKNRHLKKMIGTKNTEAKRSAKKSDTLNK